MSTREERKTEISKLLLDAAGKAKGVDWKKDSPEISAAEADLNEAVTQYVEGVTSKANVRTVYQRYRDLHKTGATV